ncbi:hypothetical protein BDN72DRAFT_836095 [Pluteus cervinus]|uniref:Uncharacterized protein n=1 Tax=Pluteus cervinus TaxID=181527 RepID=A0ACD3B4F3_9AGAR|nr:hypothetical protein BDN72DRAFT_836095 [Pluteus cervinus]
MSRHLTIFWDLDSCPPPNDMSGYTIINNIRQATIPYGPVASLKAYASRSFHLPGGSVNTFKRELRLSGVQVVETHDEDDHISASMMLLSDLFTHMMDNPSPSMVMLITQDPCFGYPLAMLRNRRYSVTLIAPHLAGVNDCLKLQAASVLDWRKDILGLEEEPTDPPVVASHSTPEILNGQKGSLSSYPRTFASPPSTFPPPAFSRPVDPGKCRTPIRGVHLNGENGHPAPPVNGTRQFLRRPSEDRHNHVETIPPLRFEGPDRFLARKHTFPSSSSGLSSPNSPSPRHQILSGSEDRVRTERREPITAGGIPHMIVGPSVTPPAARRPPSLPISPEREPGGDEPPVFREDDDFLARANPGQADIDPSPIGQYKEVNGQPLFPTPPPLVGHPPAPSVESSASESESTKPSTRRGRSPGPWQPYPMPGGPPAPLSVTKANHHGISAAAPPFIPRLTNGGALPATFTQIHQPLENHTPPPPVFPSVEAVPQLPEDMEVFRPLAVRLQSLAGTNQADSRSNVGPLGLSQAERKRVFQRANVTTFSQYVELAQLAGIVVTGGTGNAAWIRLTPSWEAIIAGRQTGGL